MSEIMWLKFIILETVGVTSVTRCSTSWRIEINLIDYQTNSADQEQKLQDIYSVK